MIGLQSPKYRISLLLQALLETSISDYHKYCELLQKLLMEVSPKLSSEDVVGARDLIRDLRLKGEKAARGERTDYYELAQELEVVLRGVAEKNYGA